MARRSPTASAAGLPGKSYRRRPAAPNGGRKATLGGVRSRAASRAHAPSPRGVYAPAVSLKPLGSRERYTCYLETFNPSLACALARRPARIDSSRGWAPSSRVQGTAADALGRGEDEPMPRLGPPQSGLHCWQSEREDQVALRRVASLAQNGPPFPGFADDFTRSRMANREARSRHSPKRAGRLATRNALRVGVKPEASPPARNSLGSGAPSHLTTGLPRHRPDGPRKASERIVALQNRLRLRGSSGCGISAPGVR